MPEGKTLVLLVRPDQLTWHGGRNSTRRTVSKYWRPDIKDLLRKNQFRWANR